MNKKIVFFNIDTQVDFIDSTGKLSVPQAEGIKPELSILTKMAKKNNITVVNTCDWHNENTEEISDNPDYKTLFPEHCMENTIGAEFIPETLPENPYVINHSDKKFDKKKLLEHRNIVIRKDKFDVFEGNKLTDKIVRALSFKKVILYGVATEICVNHAVIGLLERKKEVYVVSDAIKGLPGLTSPIKEWKSKGVKIISLDEVQNIINKNK